jgi:hypothetical protein
MFLIYEEFFWIIQEKISPTEKSAKDKISNDKEKKYKIAKTDVKKNLAALTHSDTKEQHNRPLITQRYPIRTPWLCLVAIRIT